MEVKQGCEEVQDLVDEAKERLDLFKDGGRDDAQECRNQGKVGKVWQMKGMNHGLRVGADYQMDYGQIEKDNRYSASGFSNRTNKDMQENKDLVMLP